jgi:hypothetical protein
MRIRRRCRRNRIILIMMRTMSDGYLCDIHSKHQIITITIIITITPTIIPLDTLEPPPLYLPRVVISILTLHC